MSQSWKEEEAGLEFSSWEDETKTNSSVQSFPLMSSWRLVQGGRKDTLRENHHLRNLKFYNVGEVLASQKGGGGQLRETESKGTGSPQSRWPFPIADRGLCLRVFGCQGTVLRTWGDCTDSGARLPASAWFLTLLILSSVTFGKLLKLSVPQSLICIKGW